MKDKKFLLISGIIVFLVVSTVNFSFRSFEASAARNLKESNKEPVYFGATYMTMNNPYFEVINNEIKSVVEANGDVLIALDPALSLQKQKEQIRYLLTKDVQVIFINAIEVDSLRAELAVCKKEGVIVIAVDTNIAQKDNEFIDYTVISDNYNAGVQAANDMMANKESAKIVLLQHSKTVSGAQRIQGFIDTIAYNDNYEVVASKECEGQLEIATPLMADVIASGVSFDVVMALNDPSALGALAALQEANRSDVDVYGVDGSPETKVLIKENKMRGSVSQSPKQIGKRSVAVAYRLLVGKQFEQPYEFIPVTLITKENIDDYNLEGWQ